jgi:hypothetical protein
MLDDCLPGYTKHEHGDHKWAVKCPGHETFPRLPTGQHGRARNTGRAEVEIGHVRQLAKHFKIFACAKKAIPSIG